MRWAEICIFAFTSIHEVMVHNAGQTDPKGLEKVLRSTIRDATPKEDYLSSYIRLQPKRTEIFLCDKVGSADIS